MKQMPPETKQLLDQHFAANGGRNIEYADWWDGLPMESRISAVTRAGLPRHIAGEEWKDIPLDWGYKLRGLING